MSEEGSQHTERTPLLTPGHYGPDAAARRSVSSPEVTQIRLPSSDGFEVTNRPNIRNLVRYRSRLSSYPSVSDGGDEAFADPPGTNGDIEPEPDEQDGPQSKYIGISSGKFWLIFSTIMAGYFVACFDMTLMASCHPIITSYFNASESASWLTTVFMITNTGFQPLWGRLSDTIGRKLVYLLVLTIFAVTNLWCGLSNSIGSFIAARAVCGLGAGGTMSMGLVMLNDLVRIESRGVYYSYINLAFGLGSACGAAFGGLLADVAGWRFAFFLQVPVLGVCALAALFTTPRALGPMLLYASADEGDNQGSSPAWSAIKNFDHAGVISMVLSVSFFILFLNLGGNIFPWKSVPIFVFLGLAIVCTIIMVLIERKAKQPVMPLRLLFKPPIANLVYANLLAGVASNTILFNVPLWFQAVKLTSATASGLRLAAPAIAGPIAGMATGYIITYTQRLKPTLLFGAIVYVLGSIALCLLNEHSSTAVSLLLITGAPLGQGFVYPNTMMSSFAVSKKEDQAVVTTTIGLWRNLGIVVGVAVSSLVFQNALRVNLEKFVHGELAKQIIRQARDNVRSIQTMPLKYQKQVIEAYAVSLKLTFITALVASILLLIVVAPVKLPRLSKEKTLAVASE